MEVISNVDRYTMKLIQSRFAVCDYYFPEHKVEIRIWNSPEWNFRDNYFIASFMMRTVEKFLSYLIPGYFKNLLRINVANWYHETNCPCTKDTEDYSDRIVLLSADLIHQSQFIYQFAHELVHCFQKTNSNNNNWFCEMLGELAGNFFLEEMKYDLQRFSDIYNDIVEFQHKTEMAVSK